MIYILIFFWLNIMFILQYIVCLMEHDSLIYYPKRPKKKKEAAKQAFFHKKATKVSGVSGLLTC